MARLAAADFALARGANRCARRVPAFGLIVRAGAAGLAAVQVACMVALGLSGHPRAAARMLLAVASLYLVVEVVGRTWARRRPFAARSDGDIDPLVPHAAARSFPSRHVASAVAMAVIAGAERRRLGLAMGLLAGLLGLARVGAGLHYPSDVLAGVLLGLAAGQIFRRRPAWAGAPSRAGGRAARRRRRW
jgi:membrane-associated phospholipid phosphatase